MQPANAKDVEGSPACAEKEAGRAWPGNCSCWSSFASVASDYWGSHGRQRSSSCFMEARQKEFGGSPVCRPAMDWPWFPALSPLVWTTGRGLSDASRARQQGDHSTPHLSSKLFPPRRLRHNYRVLCGRTSAGHVSVGGSPGEQTIPSPTIRLAECPYAT